MTWKIVTWSKVKYDLDPWPWILLAEIGNDEWNVPTFGHNFVMLWQKGFDHSARDITPINGLTKDVYVYNFETVNCIE